jgi:methylated-DNA-[protein]-cysteine S-methyltransferase
MRETVAFGSVDSPVGRLLAAVTNDGLAWVSFHDTPAARARAAKALDLPVVKDRERTAPIEAELEEYFAGKLQVFQSPLDWRLVSPLRRRVLTTLHETVTYGEVVTYGELGERSSSGIIARSIGQVMGSNPIPIVVPCHRVVAGNGLGGYSGGSGLEIKRWLLTFEGWLPPTLDWDPTRGPETL